MTDESIPDPTPTDDDIVADLPHPGISDEFWALLPEKDREAFSAYLVREQAVHQIAEAMDVPEEILTLPDEYQRGGIMSNGWCAPSDSLFTPFPEVTVRRGGLSFTVATPLTEWSKKELRAEVERLRRTNDALAGGNAKLRSEARRLRRKNKRLLKIIGQVA